MLIYKAVLQCSKTCTEGHLLKTNLDVNKLYVFYWDLLVSKLLSRGKPSVKLLPEQSLLKNECGTSYV